MEAISMCYELIK